MRFSILVLVGFGICWLAPTVGTADSKHKHTTPKQTKPATNPVPRLGDETLLVAIKANPEKYADCIICGVVTISNEYHDPDEHKEKDYYCLKFQEAGKNVEDPLQEDVVRLYVPKPSCYAVVSTINTLAAKKPHQRALVRVRVHCATPLVFMDALDVQLCKPDFSGWQPWIMEERNKHKQALAKEAETAAKRAEVAIAAARTAAEAAGWRTWTDTTNGSKIEAKFSGTISGVVKLAKRDGSVINIPVDNLGGEDQQWIKNRREGGRQSATEQEAEAAAKRAKAAIAAARTAAEAAGWRTWTALASGSKIEAKFDGVVLGKVKLTKRDGTTIELPLEKLCAEDQDWVKRKSP
jgi:hypothetical protein